MKRWRVFAERVPCSRCLVGSHLYYFAHGPELEGLLGFTTLRQAHTYATWSACGHSRRVAVVMARLAGAKKAVRR